jgi:hypothetical protein
LDTSRIDRIKEAFAEKHAIDTLMILSDLSERGHKHNGETPHVLTIGEKSVGLILEFDSQVSNGGFHQFFCSYGGAQSLETLKLLRAIGVEASASIFEKALSIFPGGEPATSRDERFHFLDSLGERSLAILNSLDKEYFGLNEDILTRAVDYFRDSQGDFFRFY